MRILQLCKKFPYPSKDGESVAVLSMSKGYVENGCQVRLLAMNTSKHFVHIQGVPEALSHYDSVHSIFHDTSINYIHAFLNIFQSKSFNIQRFVSDRFKLKLKSLLQNNEIDVVQLESLYMAPYINTIRESSNALIVLRSHNIEYEIWNDLAKVTRNPLKKWYYNISAKRLRSYELKQFDQYDTLIPISETDYNKYQTLNYNGSYCVSPVGLNTKNYQSSSLLISNPIKLGYIGSLDWKPNIEGINWFFNNSWFKIHGNFPNIEFHLAGRNASQNLKKAIPEAVQFHGEVENAINFLKKLDIVIVPLFSGSGIRVKILESMAMRKIVLSTKKGFEGIGIEHGKNAFIFESSDDIIKAIELCIENPERFESIQSQAQEFVQQRFDHKVLAEKVINHFKIMIK